MITGKLKEFTPKTYTHQDLAAIEETYELESITEQCRFFYQLSDDEASWLDWIGDRYSIATYLRDNLQPEDNPNDPKVIEIDVMEIARCLGEDSVDRAPCLSEETQLQRLIWFIGPDEDWCDNV